MRPAVRSKAPAAPLPAAEPEGAARGDFDRLLQLFLQTHPHRPCYWNPLTGELFAPPAGAKGAAAREAFELRLLDEDGWLELPWQESDDAYTQARNFTAQLKPGKGRAELSKALGQPKPFRAFRAVLGRHPGLARRWDAEATAEALARMVECCVAHDVTLADPRFASAQEAWEAAQACATPITFEAATPEPVASTPVRVTLGALRLGQRSALRTVDPEPEGGL